MHKSLNKLNEILHRKDKTILEMEAALSKRNSQITEMIEENSNLCRELDKCETLARDGQKWKDAFENMRDFALASGLDITTNQQERNIT